MPIVEIGRKAGDDLYSIWEWGIERYGWDSTDEFIDNLNTEFEKIADIPYGYTARPDLGESVVAEYLASHKFESLLPENFSNEI